MRTKVQKASAIALAATVLTALLSAQGSGAAPLDVRMDTIPGLAEQKPAVQYVAQPVIQPLPVQDEEHAGDESADDSTGTPPITADATSLSQLVAAQEAPQSLSSEMRCLAGAIYFEARGESLEGQLAVGRVVINRARSGRFPASYCGVVYQRSQFSFVRGRSMPAVRESSRDWQEAVAIAQIAAQDGWKSPAKGALFFHAARVSPNWHLTRLARVDNHVFYR